MKNIPKNNQKIFIEEMEKSLLQIGAVPFISDKLQFDLNTKHGVLWIRIDHDQTVCYSVYARFVSTENLPDLPNVNTWSGKFNHHLNESLTPKEASSIIVNQFKTLLN